MMNTIFSRYSGQIQSRLSTYHVFSNLCDSNDLRLCCCNYAYCDLVLLLVFSFILLDIVIGCTLRFVFRNEGREGEEKSGRTCEEKLNQ